MLAEAEAALKDVRDQMAKLAAPQTVKQALDKIAQQHTTPANFMDEAKKDLEEATNFVREKHLVTLPLRANLQVIPTPEFMRGIYSVAGFNAAPALEPQLGAFYWVTPDSPRLAQGAHRIEAARIQSLRPDGDHHPRSHARPLRAVRVRQRAGTANRAACCAAFTATDPTWKAGLSTRSR